MQPFADRRAAGRALAAELTRFANRDDVTVLALPHGGVPVAFEAATALGAPLDAFIVRKVTAPGTDDLIATIASGGACAIDPAAVRAAGFDLAKVDKLVAHAARALRRDELLYRGPRARRDLAGRTVIVVYDGMVTGASMRAAVLALRASRPARIVVAVPVASAEACRAVGRVADECVCLATPDPYFRTNVWYDDFSRISDADAIAMLEVAGMSSDRAA